MMSTLIQNLIALASAAGGALLAVAAGISHRQLCAMISFAAGALLSTTCFHILPEAWHLLPVPFILMALISGYLLFYLVNRYIFHVCPACAASHFEEQNTATFKNIFILLAIALGIHSLMDGIAIALGETSNHSIFLTISAHKFPEGLALCALLLRAGYSKSKALLWTIFLEMTTLLGWGLGTSILKEFAQSRWLHLILVHVGGAFVYLAIHAAFNEMKRHSPRFILLFFLAGFLLISFMK